MIVDAVDSYFEICQSQDSIIIPAPAKINVGLRIIGKRPDGYHNLVSIMQGISLCDKIVIERLDERGGIADKNLITAKTGIEYSGPELTTDPGDNLCVKAGVAFQEHFCPELHIRIKLEKQIPVGAGLGGGSSDAASVLLGLAKIYGVDEKDPQLLKIAARLGSDVPFFMGPDSSSLVQGVGEILSSSEGLASDLTVLVIFPNFEISTSLAYRTLDQSLTFENLNIKLLIRDFLAYNGGIPTGEMGNDFELPVFKKYPELNSACLDLKQAGALFAGLSGSGSAIYAIMGKRAAEKALAFEWLDSWSCFICRPL
ncbi:MAG: 4-(cytidine 5'-diphospho)-2-C-methyl-D-erythritol kinase [Calditrichaeota bacterium]|jgi:4-diphosphocytidyl-2-C-methyl-D-erythritol kinase|nr:4-(cytidine 5'-diphospho)-2-C-methyl-D-erythritol kinase [Calditrichota bacterium]MBT7788432.1 4-(cytidine 5'-diphospho)-2-C-methyl-D-erythritol kinase [Calditrichota bacterium]